ncbi:MAG: patatin-like phospholipase family protein [Nonomuraea sp.]|nr:patatin-like phospholipase family protein [Nonomuraea sp.]
MKKALVLGGGGVAGIAWATGLLAGLADQGVDVTDADRIVGTSAGSTVGAQITSGLSLGELLKRQTDPALQGLELPSGVDMSELWSRLEEIITGESDPVERRRLVGAMALAADTIPESRRREVIESRLPVHDWPDRDLVIVAVEAESGKEVFFGPASGVSLVDAVAASCAVPGVWPPVTIGGVRYVDGGVRTMNNADLAAGYDRVLVVSPMVDQLDLVAQVEALTGRVEIINPDEASMAAAAPDPLAPESRKPSAEAGFQQGKELAGRVGALWG